jgi:hypothetical protein
VELIEVNELAVLESAKNFLEKESECKVEVAKAEKAKEGKAKNAFPLKPAILME